MVKVKPLEDKDFESKGKWFGEGVHEVYITGVKRDTASTGSEFVEFEIVGENDETGDVRLYLTENAAERSIKILGAVAVHNKETEAEKQKVREVFKSIDDTDKLTERLLSPFVGMQAWILTEEDTSSPKPNGGFYLRNSLYSYEPTPRNKKPTVEELMGDGKPTDTSEIPF